MDCNEAQNRLLNSDVLEPQTWEQDLDAHIQTCSACQAELAGLRRLEAAARALATVPDAAMTRQAFLELLAPAPSIAAPSSDLRSCLRGWPLAMALSGRRLAMAASILLVAGMVSWLVWFQDVQKAAASDALVDSLVDWNVRLGSAQSPDQRQQIYASLAPSLQKSDGNPPVKAADQALAGKLLQTGKSLSQSVDPLDDAEQFADVADLLLERMKTAAGIGRTADAERLGRYYARVTTEGLASKMARAQDGNGKNARAKLDRLSRRERELEVRLEQLLEETPEPTRKQLRRALKGAGHQHHSQSF